MTAKTKKHLPNKLYKLIRVALADMRKCMESDKYEIQMGVWHAPVEDGICAVCAAGAVMAQTLKRKPTRELDPFDFSVDIQTKLLSLNALRMGFVGLAINEMGLPEPKKNYDCYISPFDPDEPKFFFRDMEALATRLEKANI